MVVTRYIKNTNKLVHNGKRPPYCGGAALNPIKPPCTNTRKPASTPINLAYFISH